MNLPTYSSMARYYAQLPYEDLLQNKAEIGKLLRSYASGKDITDLKETIEIINKEIKLREADVADPGV